MQLEALLTCLNCEAAIFKLYRVPAEQEDGNEGVFLNRVTDMKNRVLPPLPARSRREASYSCCPHCGNALKTLPVDV